MNSNILNYIDTFRLYNLDQLMYYNQMNYHMENHRYSKVLYLLLNKNILKITRKLQLFLPHNPLPVGD